MPARQTPLGALTIAPARSDELRIVIGIIAEAAAWLHAQGITQQWPSPIPPAFSEFMAKQIARGDVYLACIDSNAIGTFRFDWTDEELWADDPDGGGYIHSLAICKRAHGHGIGAAMLDWAKQHVRLRGKKYLRLDCWGDNAALCNYYASLGFVCVGRVQADNWVSALWQIAA